MAAPLRVALALKPIFCHVDCAGEPAQSLFTSPERHSSSGVVIFTDDAAVEIAADYRHVDGVLLQVGPHHNFLVKGACVDDRIGGCAARASHEAIIAIVGTPGSPVSTGSAGAPGRPPGPARSIAASRPAAEAVATDARSPGAAQRCCAVTASSEPRAAIAAD